MWLKLIDINIIIKSQVVNCEYQTNNIYEIFIKRFYKIVFHGEIHFYNFFYLVQSKYPQIW